MFELSVAAKYLTPRWRQLSVSIISMISIFVIALVVWLIIVFFSVTTGLTASWIEKLISLTAPIRITPTEKYYQSYYYNIDGISSKSNYTIKTIGEKRKASTTDPYDPQIDEEIPITWETPHTAEGRLVDPVKEAFDILRNSHLIANDYELTMANLRIRLLRPGSSLQKTNGFLNQTTYLGSLDKDNSLLANTIIGYSSSDIGNILNMSTIALDNIQEDVPDRIFKASPKNIQARIQSFFSHADIQELKVGPLGLKIHPSMLPDDASLRVFVALKGDLPIRILIPTNKNETLQAHDGPFLKPALLSKTGDKLELKWEDGSFAKVKETASIILPQGTTFLVDVIQESVNTAHDPSHVRFKARLNLQGYSITKDISLGRLEISRATLKTNFDEEPNPSPFWLHRVKDSYVLPSSPEMGEAILLPKSFRDSGAFIGDGGSLSYYSPTISSIQEQRTPIYIAGFYDPGILPMGGKFILANPELANLIRTSQDSSEALVSNGINVRFKNWEDASAIKEQLQTAFQKAGIAPYWKIETFREFEFTKDILQQLGSEKRLFSMLAAIIIIVACSNIISMLIILVNDKKLEIGILRSMGASSFSITVIFGTCGVVMGILGGLIGTIAAFLTLQNLQLIVGFISRIQGQEMFHPLFYGDSLPTDISVEVFLYVMAATASISLVSGFVPAIKACLLRPSAILKAE